MLSPETRVGSGVTVRLRGVIALVFAVAHASASVPKRLRQP